MESSPETLLRVGFLTPSLTTDSGSGSEWLERLVWSGQDVRTELELNMRESWRWGRGRGSVTGPRMSTEEYKQYLPV